VICSKLVGVEKKGQACSKVMGKTCLRVNV